MKDGGVRVHIETLVLEGFAAGDRARIADGVERELARLFVANRLPLAWRQPRQVDRLAGPVVQLPPAAAPEQVGVRIAGSVYGAFRRRSR